MRRLDVHTGTKPGLLATIYAKPKPMDDWQCPVERNSFRYPPAKNLLGRRMSDSRIDYQANIFRLNSAIHSSDTSNGLQAIRGLQGQQPDSIQLA
jgi:hypothetical protein